MGAAVFYFRLNRGEVLLEIRVTFLEKSVKKANFTKTHYFFTHNLANTMLKEFKDFLMKGNVLDLAVAVLIGAAFGDVVTNFTDGILMPPIGMALGNVDFSDMAIVLKDVDPNVLGEEGEVAIRYGQLINSLINFIIVAFILFMIIKAYNASQKKEEAAPAAPAGPTTEELLTQIRDLLKKG